MSSSTKERAASPAHQGHADLATRLNNLRYELGRLEALASVASEKLEYLPHTSSTQENRELRQLHHLVTLVAEESARVLDRCGFPETQARLGDQDEA